MADKSSAHIRDDKSVIENERLQYVETLLETSQEMSALDTLDAVFQALVRVAVERTNSDRGTLFLHDDTTHELYSRIAQGIGFYEIRIMDTDGIAGSVFQSEKSEIVNDPYSDERFKSEVDSETGYSTESILCTTVRNAKGKIIGVLEVLNKQAGEYGEQDILLLEGLTTQCAVPLQSFELVEHIEHHRLYYRL